MNSITERSPCIICLENTLESEDTVACTNEVIPHVFHRACALQWARTRPFGERVVCLLCREGSFLPVEGSLTGNETSQELAEIQTILEQVERNSRILNQGLPQLAEQIRETVQRLRQRNPKTEERLTNLRAKYCTPK